MNRKRAFTLIELLVVIAIIAILAAILFPVFAKARERAKQSRSLNNLKQLAIGVQSYAQDYSETFPGWQQNSTGKFAHNVWDEQINPMLKSKDVYNNSDTGFQSWADPQKQRVVTYGLNGLLICTPSSFTGSTYSTMSTNESGGTNAPAPLSASTVSDPANTILFAELATEAAVQSKFQTWTLPEVANQVANGSEQWQSAMRHWIDISPREFVENANPSTGSYTESTWLTTSGVARDMYGGGGNYAFVDGHVKFQKVSQTVGLGQTVTPASGSAYQVTPGANAWRVDNLLNQWNPSR